MSVRVLVIDDDQPTCRLLQVVFKTAGFEVLIANDGSTGAELAKTEFPDLVVLNLGLPRSTGLEVLSQFRREDPTLPVVILTAHTEVKTAVHATKLGAFDYLTKPVDDEALLRVARRALETRALRAEVAVLRTQVRTSLVGQMGPSDVVTHIAEQVSTVATSDFSVLLLGETGTGKELVAQAIHRQSSRAAKPFIAVDCGAIPENLLESELFGHERGAFTGADKRKQGRFVLAEGGTLFLDEIGNLPLGLQSKLLRALESRTVHAIGASHSTAIDVRFIAATNDDLQTRATSGGFRSDLYFRLAQYTISLPPLRHRVDDVLPLAKRFLQEASVELRQPVSELGEDAMELLKAHGWPGNVRELRNVIRRAVLETKDGELRASAIERFLLGQASDAPRPASARRNGRSLKEIALDAAREAEHRVIVETLRETNGNKAEAARLLRTDYKTLHLKIKALGIRAR